MQCFEPSTHVKHTAIFHFSSVCDHDDHDDRWLSLSTDVPLPTPINLLWHTSSTIRNCRCAPHRKYIQYSCIYNIYKRSQEEKHNRRTKFVCFFCAYNIYSITKVTRWRLLIFLLFANCYSRWNYDLFEQLDISSEGCLG